MSCNIGIHNAISKILNNKPWFKYKKGDNFIQILNSPALKINENNAIGVAKTVANSINKEVNKHYPKVGNIVQAEFYRNGAIVNINPTKAQLDYINAVEEKDVIDAILELEKESILKELQDRQEEGNWQEVDGEIIPIKRQFIKLPNLPSIEPTC